MNDRKEKEKGERRERTGEMRKKKILKNSRTQKKERKVLKVL